MVRPVELVVEHCVRAKAQAVVDGGEEVFGGDYAVFGFGAHGVGGAVDDAGADAAAGEGDGEDVAPVVAPAAGVELGGSAKLAHPDDERFIEHASVIEIINQGATCSIHRRHQFVFEQWNVILVRVPHRAVVGAIFVAGPVDLYEGYA